MKALQALMWVASGVVGLGLLGCDLTIGRSSPQRVYVAQPQPDYVIVGEAPPALIVEQRSSPPSGDYIWIDGYWDWNGRQYAWLGGHWDRPPHEHYIWVAPRYESYQQGYRYTRGQWREEQRGDQRRDRR
jgi:hypothetical protein